MSRLPSGTNDRILSITLDARHLFPDTQLCAVQRTRLILPSFPSGLWRRAAQVRAQLSPYSSHTPLARALFIAGGAARRAAGREERGANPGLGLGIHIPRREVPRPESLGRGDRKREARSEQPGKRSSPAPLMDITFLGDLDVFSRGVGAVSAGARLPPAAVALVGYLFQ